MMVIQMHNSQIKPLISSTRVIDTEVGIKMGFSDPLAIRKLIRSNKKQLLLLGSLTFKTVANEGGGRPGNVYYLNKRQVLFLLLTSPKTSKEVKIKSIESMVDLDSLISAIEDFEVPENLQDLYVYAIRELDSGRIKLGISIDPSRRLKQLQTGNSSKLELVAYKKADNRFNDEKKLHDMAKDFNIRGEWFDGNVSTLLN